MSAAPHPPAEPSPWVQMPSVVRRVRAQLLGQPEPQPAADAAAAASARLHTSAAAPVRTDTAAAEAGLPADPTLSLPLPLRRRPPLPPAAADSTMSLPLPAAQPRPALAGVRHRSAGPSAVGSLSAAAQEQQPLMEAAAQPGQPAAAEEGAAEEESAADKAARLGRPSAAGAGLTGATTLRCACKCVDANGCAAERDARVCEKPDCARIWVCLPLLAPPPPRCRLNCRHVLLPLPSAARRTRRSWASSCGSSCRRSGTWDSRRQPWLSRCTSTRRRQVGTL